MIAGPLDFLRVATRGLYDLRFLRVKFTFECNIRCKICIEESADQKELLPISKIEHVFRQLPDLEIDMGLQGGEVMLYPEYCAEICDLWRKYNKWGHTHMISNGYWGDDPKITDIMINKIKPELLMITVDKFHQEFIPISKVNSIIDNLKNTPDILLGFLTVYSKDDPWNFEATPLENQQRLGLVCDQEVSILANKLVSAGRAINYISSSGDDVPNRHDCEDEELVCNNFGIALLPNEEVVSNCGLERWGCKFGTIDTVDMKKLFESLGRPHVKYTGKNVQQFLDICRNLKINPLDPVWSKK
jgi:hypothetical protein